MAAATAHQELKMGNTSNAARILRLAMTGLILTCSAAYAAEPTTMVKIINGSGARRVIDAARQAAESLKAPCAIAVVDPSGILVSFERMDGVRAGSPDLAVGKARTSALLQRPSEEVESNIAAGRVAFVTAGFLALRGGMPLVVNGDVVGAVGIAGLSKDSDVLIAKAAAQSLSADSSGAEH
jgi:glc operon protein GlcG